MARDIGHAAEGSGGMAASLASLPGGMALLGLFEFVLSSVVIYAIMQGSGAMAATAAYPAASAALAAATLAVVALSIGLYRQDVLLHRSRLLSAAAFATAVAFAVLVLLAGSLGRGITAPQALSIAAVIGAWGTMAIVLRLAAGVALRHGRAQRRILLLGDPTRVERLLGHLHSRRGRRFDAVISHARDAAPDLAWPELRQRHLWAVITTPGIDTAAMDALLDSKLRGQRVIGSADFLERGLGRIDLDSLTAEGLLTAEGFARSRASDGVKRACDIAFAGVLGFVTLPLMLLTALVIKADSPGPVLYRQVRIGAFGRPFTVFKFRSMSVDAEAGGRPRWAQKHDPRVTRVGRFIRLTRIDELPQLLNVLRGEMSLVGPRPERPHFVEQLTQAIPFYAQRTYVKPGLTGWAQVNYPYGASVEDAREKLAYDLYYVKHRSFWLDSRILLATVRVVLHGEGAR